MASIDKLRKLNLHVGKVLKLTLLKKHQYRLPKSATHEILLDFGRKGKRKWYTNLKQFSNKKIKGKFVVGLFLPKRERRKWMSEVLVLSTPSKSKKVVLIQPAQKVNIGSKVL